MTGILGDMIKCLHLLEPTFGAARQHLCC